MSGRTALSLFYRGENRAKWVRNYVINMKKIDEKIFAEYNISVYIDRIQYQMLSIATNFDVKKGCDDMVTTESVTIRVPIGMSKYLTASDAESELTRNALLLYPYVANQTISHGRAAEILGIKKSEFPRILRNYETINFQDFFMTFYLHVFNNG